MRKLVAFLLVVSLLGFATVVTPLVSAEASERAPAGTELPRALQKINPAEVELISDAEAQEIRGEWWPIIIIGYYYIAANAPIWYEYGSMLYDGGTAIADMLADWLN